MQLLKRRSALASILCTFSLTACGAANCAIEPSIAEPSTQLPSRPEFRFVDRDCSIEPNGSIANPFDEGAARQALRAGHARAALCGEGAPSARVNLIWGPSGCVRFVGVEAVSASRVAECVVNEFQGAALDGFDGSAVGAKSASSGNDEFWRIPIAPEVIQRVVRSHFAQFRECYQQGLGRDPSVGGTVTARFVILQSGSVSHVENAGSDLPDAEVVDCILRSFVGMTFPPPTGRDVTVVYPIKFSRR